MDMLRCSWCDKRCRDRAELKAHHDEHRRARTDISLTCPATGQPCPHPIECASPTGHEVHNCPLIDFPGGKE